MTKVFDVPDVQSTNSTAMERMLFLLLLLEATASSAKRDSFMSLFIRDLAEHYGPMPLTLIYDDQEEQNLEENMCSTSTIFCVGANNDNGQSMSKIIEYFGDQTVVVFMKNIDTYQLTVVKPTILKYGKPVFLLIGKNDSVPSLRVDNNIIFFNPIKSKEEILLFDKYNTFDGVPITQTMGIWRKESGLNLTKSSKWEWRNNLNGKQLIVSVLRWPPFFDYTLDQEGFVVDPKGLLFDILQELANNLNFTTIMTTPKDGQWGSKTDKGDYTGLIGDLVHKEADIAPSGLYLVKWRQEVVDFTLPVLEDLQTFIAKESSGKAINYTVYFEIFLPQAWILVCISFVSMTFIFYFLTLMDKRQANTIHEVLLSIAASGRQLIQRPQDISRFTYVGARMTLLIFALHSYVLFAYYTCNLKAAMTSTAPRIGISSFEDARRNGYKVLVIDGSSHSLRVKDKGLNLMMLKPHAGTSYPELIAKTMSEESSKVLNFGSSLSFAGSREFYPLTITESLTQMVSFALQQDSEYRELFNHHLKKLDEKGILDILGEKYLPKRTTPQYMLEAIPLGYDNVLFPSLVMFLGISFSLLMVCIERFRRYIDNFGVATRPIQRPVSGAWNIV